MLALASPSPPPASWPASWTSLEAAAHSMQKVQSAKMDSRLGLLANTRLAARKVHTPRPSRTHGSCARNRLHLCHSGDTGSSSCSRTRQSGLHPLCLQMTTAQSSHRQQMLETLPITSDGTNESASPKIMTCCPRAVQQPPCTRLKRFGSSG